MTYRRVFKTAGRSSLAKSVLTDEYVLPKYVTEAANAQPAWDGVSAEEEKLGVVRGAMRDVETSEVQTGRRPIAPFVTAIPSHLVQTRV